MTFRKQIGKTDMVQGRAQIQDLTHLENSFYRWVAPLVMIFCFSIMSLFVCFSYSFSVWLDNFHSLICYKLVAFSQSPFDYWFHPIMFRFLVFCIILVLKLISTIPYLSFLCWDFQSLQTFWTIFKWFSICVHDVCVCVCGGGGGSCAQGTYVETKG